MFNEGSSFYMSIKNIDCLDTLTNKLIISANDNDSAGLTLRVFSILKKYEI
jgi:hypothetical protein